MTMSVYNNNNDISVLHVVIFTAIILHTTGSVMIAIDYIFSDQHCRSDSNQVSAVSSLLLSFV